MKPRLSNLLIRILPNQKLPTLGTSTTSHTEWASEIFLSLRALCKKARIGYRTASSSERDKDSSSKLIIFKSTSRVLNHYPARYRSRFCTDPRLFGPKR